jgi:hypothetical protein
MGSNPSYINILAESNADWQFDQAINLSVCRKVEGQARFWLFRMKWLEFAYFRELKLVALAIPRFRGHMNTV